MKNQFEMEIKAPCARVFKWLDDPALLTQWTPDLIEYENLEETQEGVGTTFRQVYDEAGKRIEMHGVVTAYEQDRRLACEMTGQSFDLLLDYRLESTPEGTLLAQACELRFKGAMKIFMWLAAPFLKGAAQRQLEASFGILKRIAESDA